MSIKLILFKIKEKNKFYYFSTISYSFDINIVCTSFFMLGIKILLKCFYITSLVPFTNWFKVWTNRDWQVLEHTTVK